MTLRGRFVWHELVTRDLAGAQCFYTSVLGWNAQASTQDLSCSMFVGPSGPLGALYAESSRAPSWIPYICTPDIAATVQQATSLGGSVRKEITTMAKGCKYAHLRDPHGALFGVCLSQDSQSHDESAPMWGEVSWNKLATTDHAAAFRFYSALFGWDTLNEQDTYRIFGSGGVPRGGMFNRAPQTPSERGWWMYVRVRDLYQTMQQVKAARGTLVNGPIEAAGGDRTAQFLDPYGALFAVHTVAADLKAAEPAPAIKSR